ncbi:hypothetical protein C8J56DRAFT_764310, partial [Mycena floridula]
AYIQLGQDVNTALRVHLGDAAQSEAFRRDCYQYLTQIEQYSGLFSTPDYDTLRSNVQLMASELDRARHLSSDPALHPFPTIISHEYTGARPRIHIDPIILEVALDTRGPTQLAQVFQVHLRTIRRRALEAGICESAPPVYVEFEHEDGSVHQIYRSCTGASTNISDDELDKLVLTILESFPSLGRRMINGSLKHMGVTIPRSHLEASQTR